jgi:hypothetical protein
VEHATKAMELTDWKRGEWLEILAAAYAERGDFQQAVEWQTKAIEAAEDEPRKAELRSRLKRYQAGKAYREASLDVESRLSIR